MLITFTSCNSIETMLLPEVYCIDLDFQFEYLNIDYQNYFLVNCRVIYSFLLPKPSIIGWCNIKLAFVGCHFSFNKSKCILRQLKVTKVQPCCGYSQILNGSRQDGGLGQQQQLEVGVQAVAGAGVGVGAGDPAVVDSGVGTVSATAFSPVTLFRLSFVCCFCARCSLLCS